MKALLHIEIIQIIRNWKVFILSVGMPALFFLFYSSMQMADSAEGQAQFVQGYMLTMTGFAMSSFALFTFPLMLVQDRTNHYLTYISHSPLSVGKYYLAKVLRVLLYFLIAILVTFTLGYCLRDVHLSWERWLGSAGLLLMGSLVFIAIGLLLTHIQSEQLMSIVGNILFLGLAILGGSWMPISLFPEWVQSISKFTPTYHLNDLVTDFAKTGHCSLQSLLILLAYAIIIGSIALVISHKKEDGTC